MPLPTITATTPMVSWIALRQNMGEGAEKAAEFASAFGSREWGEFAGLSHESLAIQSGVR